MAGDSILPTCISFVLASPLCSLCVLMFHTMFHTCFIPPCPCCVHSYVRCERCTLNDRESQVRAASMWTISASVPSCVCVCVCTAACACLCMCACVPACVNVHMRVCMYVCVFVLASIGLVKDNEGVSYPCFIPYVSYQCFIPFSVIKSGNSKKDPPPYNFKVDGLVLWLTRQLWKCSFACEVPQLTAIFAILHPPRVTAHISDD